MKRLYLSLAALTLASAAGVTAQSKISPSGRIMIEQVRQERRQALSGTPSKITLKGAEKITLDARTKRVGALVLLNPGFTADDIEAAGFEVSSATGRVAVVRAGIDEIEALSVLDAVRLVDFGKPRKLMNNTARAALGVDESHSGFEYSGATHSYTGKGVITGIYDSGVMPNHINFLNAAGTTRVQRLWHYYTDEESGDGYVSAYDSPENVTTFSTDDETASHGTHTLGIMAGGYKGNIIAIDYDSDNTGNGNNGFTVIQDDGTNPFYGMATESDIAVGCGELEDAFMSDAMGKIVDYATEEGKPCVINYSIGSLVGPHDGTDAFSQYLTSLAEQGATICVAAGNEADARLSMEVTSTTKTFVEAGSGGTSVGFLDMWSSDGEPFGLEFIAWSKSRLGSAKETTLATLSAANSTVQQLTTSNSNFKSAFTAGSIQYLSEVNQANGRYNALALIQVQPKSTLLSTTRLGIRITPKAGQKVYVWFSGQSGELSAASQSGYTDGSYDNCISNETCAEGVIPVGAYATRKSWGTLSGNGYAYNAITKGDILPFSSYGKRFDGKPVPTVTAPGIVVSSMSTPYVNYCEQNNAADSIGAMSAGVNTGSATYFYGLNMGTSMATPAVAGSIALWLEADPSLTPYEIEEIIGTTSDSDSYTTASAAKFGAGKINALEGLKEVLRRKILAAIGNVTGDADADRNVIITQSGDRIEIFAAGDQAIRASLFNVTGTEVRSVNATGDQAHLDASGLARGIYVLRVDTAAGPVTRKLAVR